MLSSFLSLPIMQAQRSVEMMKANGLNLGT